MDKKWWTLIAVCTGMFMLLLDVTIVIVAQPAIQDGLHASFTEVQWVLDAYALTLAAFETGRRPPTIGLVLCLAALANHDRAAEEEAELESDDRDHGDHRITERVTSDHDPLAQRGRHRRDTFCSHPRNGPVRYLRELESVD